MPGADVTARAFDALLVAFLVDGADRDGVARKLLVAAGLHALAGDLQLDAEERRRLVAELADYLDRLKPEIEALL